MNIVNKVTLRTLWKNKVRTIVTIIGIILSAAMITAVTTGVSSFKNLFYNIIVADTGDWHGRANSVASDKLHSTQSNGEVNSLSYIENIGYAKLDKSQNENKPYLFIGGMSSNFKDMLPVNLTSGSMPKSNSEIILPQSLYSNAGVKYAIGDKLTLAVGDRINIETKGILTQSNSYDKNSASSEKFNVRETKTYTVVGFYKRASFENLGAPGYTALTVSDNTKATSYDVFMKLNNPKGTYDFMKNNFKDYGTDINQDLLRALLSSNDEMLYKMLYNLAAVLIVIIVFGSVSLIYNAFSMSVSERTKQFGLLSSIGSTKKQLMRSVLFEALFLSLIGIPLGILSGMGGLAVTFKLTQGLFKSMSTDNNPITLSLSVSLTAIIAAVAVGLITVLISAFIPAIRATRMSAIEAIRQSNDIKIKGKKVKTSKLTYKLFGFEGMIASKNFKRNRKKYRATVVSLFMSVVLFISASSFSSYLTKSSQVFLQDVNFDIKYSVRDPKSDFSGLFKSLSNVNGVTKKGYSKNVFVFADFETSKLNKDSINTLINKSDLKKNDKTLQMYVSYCFIDDETYKDYLKENNFDQSKFMNVSEPQAVAIDMINYNSSGKRYVLNMFDKNTTSIDVHMPITISGYHLTGKTSDSNGNTIYNYVNDKGDTKSLTEKDALKTSTVKIGAITDKKSFVTDLESGASIILMYPYSAYNTVMKDMTNIDKTPSTSLYFNADNNKEVYNSMVEVLNNSGKQTTYLTNYAELASSNRSLITLLNIFSYGFIILISLIAMANVFNTISTNISLRRREFAMLKSVGMTKRGFNRMMNFECLLYGMKGLIYGIPVSLGITYLIYLSVQSSWNAAYFVPWQSIIIATASVFIVVFSTMLYSMRKIKKDNPIDALKNENL